MKVSDYAQLIVRGGWPQVVTTAMPEPERFVRNYLAYAVDRAIPDTDGPRHDPLRLERFLRAYAQFNAQPAPLTKIISRVVGDDAPSGGRNLTLTWHTADAYHDAAEQLMLVADLPAWSPQLRSRARLANLHKRHFTDPSLAASLLGANGQRLLREPTTLGFLFESMVTRDVRVYAQACGAQVFHYRERNGELEVDLVVERPDGAWLGIEVKLGSRSLDDAAASLRRLAEHRVAHPPAALVIITATEYAYRRPDGVDVVPLGTLGP